GYTQFTATAYSTATGYGWENTSSIYADTRSSGNDLEIDMHQIDAEKRFFVDVPDGTYNVTLHFYDASFGQLGINVDIESANVISNFNLNTATHITRTFETSVTDSQLTIRIYSSIGAGMILNGLEVEEIGGCNDGATRICDTGLQGACSAGEQTCSNEIWGICGQIVFPSAEICGNGIDEDCDGSDLQCPSGDGVIFEDDFEGWTDFYPAEENVIWDTRNGSTANIATASNGKWCNGMDWNEYGLPDTQVITSQGRNNSSSLVGNIESRVQPAAGLTTILQDRTHDELYFRWYTKYDPEWGWWPSQTSQKLARIRWTPEGSECYVSDPDDIIPIFAWGNMVHAIFPVQGVTPTVYSSPEALWSNYGPDNWISLEFYVKLNDLGQSNGVLTSWINGVKVLHSDEVFLRQSDTHINSFNIGDNIIYTNAAGSSGVPWFPPEERQIWWDDIVVSTNYIGPESCPDGTEITLENVGPCYCGGSPNPGDTSNVYTSGYCCSGAWQSSSCSAQCTESWSCTTWSSCVNNQQTRTCTDANDCGTTNNKPAELQSCSLPGEGVIFEDNFDGWHEIDTDYPGVLCDGNDNIELCRPEGSEWCGFSPYSWSDYGLPDSQVKSNGGRFGSNSLVSNIESRIQPTGSLTGWIPEKNHDELYFRWYLKYDPTWSWWPEQNGQKLARIQWNPEGTECGALTEYAKSAWNWGRMVYYIGGTIPTIYSDPEVYWYDYEPGNWILLENYIKLNTVGESNGVLSSWIDGKKVLHIENMELRTSDVHLNKIAFPGNIIYTNQPGSSGVPWFPPEEKQLWTDDFVISTNYIGPEPCPDGTKITMENVGACYCGTSYASPDCNATDPSACTGIVDSGYCCNNSWQENACTPPEECLVDVDACTISLGTLDNCSQDNLVYQYEVNTTVENTVIGLQENKSYDIKIENLTVETEQNISRNSNSEGVLEFSS
ncbi:MAG: polysaccharide lyase, partial [Candidatus Diapherotrites archaeon]